MTSASAQTTAASYRSAGRAAITSGVIGLVAYGFLWAFLITMVSGGDEQTSRPLITTHDVGVLLQSLFMIPLVLAFGGIVGQRSRGARRSIVAMGIAALGLTIFSLLLIIANVLAGPFFMFCRACSDLAHRRQPARVGRHPPEASGGSGPWSGSV